MDEGNTTQSLQALDPKYIPGNDAVYITLLTRNGSRQLLLYYTVTGKLVKK